MEISAEQEASAKLAQHLVVAVQVAEAVIRLRQHRLDNHTDATGQAAGAARAGRTAQHAADRVVWSPALSRDWVRDADLNDLGRAWGAAAGWADTDPTAHVAATRVETRLSEMAPAAMARFDELRETGTDRVDAMRDVLAHIAAERRNGRDPIVIDSATQTSATQTSATHASTEHAQSRADAAADQARRSESTPDDPSTPLVDEHADGVRSAVVRRDEQAAWQATADTPATDRQVAYIGDLLERSPGLAGDRPTDPAAIARMTRAEASSYITDLGGTGLTRRVTPAGNPHAADVAADSYPHPYIDVRPISSTTTKTAARTIPAARNKVLTR